MTAPPQTHQPISPGQDGTERSWPKGIFPAAPECSGRTRQSLPAVDASTVFGCVDWFLYPEAEARAAAAA